MAAFIQQLANGVMLGSIYALVAAGVALIFGVLHIPQFALGAQAMLGAYLVFTLSVSMSLNYWIALAAAAVIMAVFGAVAHRVVFDPIRNAPSINAFISAFGLVLVLESGAQIIWGSSYKRVPSPLGGETITILGASLTAQRLLIIVVALIIVLALHTTIRRTTLGSTIRAVAQNPTGAAVVGINPRAVATLTMAIGSAVAATAGGLIAPISSVFPSLGAFLIIKAFVITILGGMGSFTGAIAGGFIFGIVEALGAGYVSVEYKDAFGFVILVLVLAMRPQGLFGATK
ncbi:branched-chain amino acid ABC transporter permease [Intrasporangium calvum]|uniref:Inner-membrane translocator n=1 Tax=Intrasporangium calvum (strain ATCC 23552 / DSM 43043 / JCM 3097 / NBRC 12989 / NCIMB 10167 / NRRL B-3866 / 7 KIP) TaxID=710696 RepID=E6SCM8_INTC7|nr:branched-chain amino acid ABC transporter permease [Intrasporangium calvum]ADU49632.1 inner-membrane translocator [Intrasporangium calvum DSM 43043]